LHGNISMRLSKRLKIIIKKAIKDNFGPVDTYLFGSRVDDSKKGGDIDIAIDVNCTAEDFRVKKIQFISSLLKLGFDLKIDLVQYQQKDKLFSDEIKKNSVML